MTLTKDTVHALNWCIPEGGNASWEAGGTLALLRIVDELRAINRKLDTLGIDGIHRVIRGLDMELQMRRKKPAAKVRRR